MRMNRGARPSSVLGASMSVMSRRAALAFMLSAITVSGADAQIEGVVPLRTGFTPDPAVLVGTAVGRSPLDLREPVECGAGFFSGAPSHVLQFETRVGFLRFYATGPGDLALAVRDAENHWHCNDDRFGRHPSVEGTWTQGRVEVWVGTHAPSPGEDYELRLTETRSMRPGVGPEGGDSGDESELARDAGFLVDAESGRFDGIRLRRGFLPDPRFLAGDSTLPADEEGTDANVMGGECHGLVSHAPSHVITLLDDFDFLQLYLLPMNDARWPGEEPPGLSMVILRPDGTFECEESGDGIEVSGPTWAPGVYRVWVGTDLGEGAMPYRLGISEIRRVR